MTEKMMKIYPTIGITGALYENDDAFWQAAHATVNKLADEGMMYF